MLIRDALTGRLHEVHDQLYRSHMGEYGQPYEQRYPQGHGYSLQYGMGQVVYDGLGNPVGLFPLLAKLAPIAAKALPAIAAKALPAITKVFPSITRALPMVSNFFPGVAPSPAAMMQPPTAMPPMPFQTPAPPVMAMPGTAPTAVPYPMMTMMAPRVLRRWRRARRPIRRQIAVPPPTGIGGPVGGAGSDGPPNTVQGWGYYERFNGYGRW